MNWRGATALVLACCIGGGWAITAVAGALNPGTLTDAARDVLLTLGGALVGGIVAWLSSGHRGDKDDPPDP